MQITIDTKDAQPKEADWQRLLDYLSLQFIGGAALETLRCVFISEDEMPAEQEANELHDEPVWRTTDDSGFILWLYANGSDSEG
jgi:hypothetical protein